MKASYVEGKAPDVLIQGVHLGDPFSRVGRSD